MWTGFITGLLGVVIIVVGVFVYAWAVKEAFMILLNGGEDRFLELIEINDKNAEFFALEKLYSLVKPISIRLPVEIEAYKVTKLHNKEKELQELLNKEGNNH